MKKKYSIIGIAIITLIGIGCFTLGGAQSEDVAAGVKVENTVDVADKDIEAEDKNEKPTEKADSTFEKDNKATNSDKAAVKNNSTSEKDNSGKNSSNTSSNKNSTSTSNKNESATKPTHTHNWVAVQKEVDNGYYKTTTTEIPWARCNRCGTDITSDPNGHLAMHLEKGETEKVSWSTKYRTEETKQWVPKIEKVLDYYKCNCGATKKK